MERYFVPSRMTTVEWLLHGGSRRQPLNVTGIRSAERVPHPAESNLSRPVRTCRCGAAGCWQALWQSALLDSDTREQLQQRQVGRHVSTAIPKSFRMRSFLPCASPLRMA